MTLRSPACARLRRAVSTGAVAVSLALAPISGSAQAPEQGPVSDSPVSDEAPDNEAPDNEAPDNEAPSEPIDDPPPPPSEDPPPRPSGVGPGRCAARGGDADPFQLIDAVLDGLANQGFGVGQRLRQTSFRGTDCAVTLAGGDPAFLHYQLERTAEAGYLFVLIPTGREQHELLVRAVDDSEERGIVITNIERVEVSGKYRSGDSSIRLRKILGVGPGTLIPATLDAQLQQLGYRATLHAEGPGHMMVVVEPGRSIRRVRVHGHIPVSKRDIQRELGITARPGALAQGACISPTAARGDTRPPLCAPEDLACASWEADELTRLSRFLFDKGYLQGKASLSLVCGRHRDEADLHVYIQKGPAYRVRWRDVNISGNMPPPDQRWMKRTFWPRVRATPFPSRLTRESIEESKDRAIRRYAEPRTSTLQSAATPELTLPYPEIQIETSYDDLRPGQVPADTHTVLDVRVDLGRGVKTTFLGNRSYSDLRLRNQMQLFKRHESPGDQVAIREAANLRAYYQSRGFLLADVRGRYEEFGSKAPGALYFQIKEGPIVTIRSVDQVITRGVPPGVAADIRRDFDRDRKLRRGSSFTEAHVVDDLTALIQRFHDRGFLCARAKVDVAFWPEGLDQAKAHAEVDAATVLRRDPRPTWATRDFDPDGLRQILSRKRANLYVRITVEPGPRVFTTRREERIRYLDTPIPGERNVDDLPERTTAGAWGARRIFADGPLRRPGDTRPGGVALTPNLDREVEESVTTRYRDSGFPVADAEIRWLYTDPRGTVYSVDNARRLADDDIGMCAAFPSGTAVEVEAQLSVYEGRRGEFGDTLLRGNFKTRDRILRRQLAYKPQGPYQRSAVDDSQTHIDGLGVAEAVEITPYTVACDHDSNPDEMCTVHHIVEIRESKDVAMNLSGGFGLATLDPFYVFLNPAFPNMWGTAWDLDILGHYGFNTSQIPRGVPFLGDCAGQRCYERSVRGSLTRPRIFASPLTLDLGGQYQLRLTPARGRIESAIGTLTFTYPINRRWQMYFGYLIQRSNISQDVVKPVVDPAVPLTGTADVFNRRDAIVADRTGALQLGVSFTDVDNAFNPDDGFIAQADVKFAAPVFGGIDWFIRADLAWQHFIPIPRTAGRLNFRYALRYGHAIPLPGLPLTDTTSVPEIWRYFGGGTVDLGLRGLLPETMLVDIESVDQAPGAQRLDYTAQGGHIRALATIALQVVSAENVLGGKIAHSLFFDFGVLAQKWRQVQFARDFRRSVGINFLKWDIKIVTLALGYAILLPNAIAPGNVKPIDNRFGRFIFDVGVTF